MRTHIATGFAATIVEQTDRGQSVLTNYCKTNSAGFFLMREALKSPSIRQLAWAALPGIPKARPAGASQCKESTRGLCVWGKYRRHTSLTGCSSCSAALCPIVESSRCNALIVSCISIITTVLCLKWYIQIITKCAIMKAYVSQEWSPQLW